MARKRILCKVPIVDNFYGDERTMIIYTDETFRYNDTSVDDCVEWKLAYSDLGPIFLFKEGPYWKTDWCSEEPNEVRIAETIAQSLANLEVEKMLKLKNLTVEQAVEEKCKELIREGVKF